MAEYILNENTEYALRILLYLMPYGTVAPMSEAAGYLQVSRERIRAIGAKLKLAGIVKPVMGSYGGYTLARDPCSITLYEVISGVETPNEATDSSDKICQMFLRAQQWYVKFLKEHTLNDLYTDVTAQS